MTLNKIDGTKNPADMFTKPLTRQPFEMYRKQVMNLTSTSVSVGEDPDAVKSEVAPSAAAVTTMWVGRVKAGSSPKSRVVVRGDTQP